jgi:hypothetical protein
MGIWQFVYIPPFWYQEKSGNPARDLWQSIQEEEEGSPKIE